MTSQIPAPKTESEKGTGNTRIKTVIRLASYFCVPVAFITTFVGLVEFFFVSILVILTGLVTLFTYTVANWPDLPIQLLWVIYLLPVMELLLSLCFDISKAFFGEIWSIVNLHSVRRYIARQIVHFVVCTNLMAQVFIGLKIIWLVVCFLFLIVFLLWSLVGLILDLAVPPSAMALIFGVYCLLTPLICVFQVLLCPWFFRFPMLGSMRDSLQHTFEPKGMIENAVSTKDNDPAVEPTEQCEPNPTEDLKQAMSVGKTVLDAMSKPTNGSRHMSIFDPCGLRDQTLWCVYLEERTNAFFRKRGLSQKIRLIPLLLLGCCAIAIIALDIRREGMVRRENAEREALLNSVPYYHKQYAVLADYTEFNPDTYNAWIGLPNIHIQAISHGVSILELVIRILWIAVSLPFTISSHPVSWIIEKILHAKSDKDDSISISEPMDTETDLGGIRMKIFQILGIVVFVLGVCFSLTGAILRAKFSPFRLNNFQWEDPTWEPVTNSTTPLMCAMDINGWNLMHFAAIPVMLDLMPDELYTSFSMDVIKGEYADGAFGWDIEDVLDGGYSELVDASEAVYRYVLGLQDYPVSDPDYADIESNALC
jgi:hypothetical protein